MYELLIVYIIIFMNIDYNHIVIIYIVKPTSLMLAGQLSIKGCMFNGIISSKETLFHMTFYLPADGPTCINCNIYSVVDCSYYV